MPWTRKGFKGGKVYARVDDAGALVVENGLVEIRYRENDERTYRARVESLQDLGAPPAAADPDPAAAARSAAPPRGRRGKAPRVLGRPRPGALHVYTDGACTGNPGPAGIGAVLLYRGSRREISEYLGKGTNNIAELTAVLRALETVKNPRLPVDVCLDSSYAIGVLSQGWKAKANRELIEQVQREMERFPDLCFVKVPGHAGVPENERADELAREAIERGR